jgi:hypothetical protein
MKMSYLKEVIENLKRQSRRLREAEEAQSAITPEDAVTAAESSIDRQIDKFLLQAIQQASTMKESVDLRAMTRNILEGLLDDEGAGDEEDSGDDSEKDSKPVAPVKKTLEEIDIGSYADSVARLIDNFNDLIEIRDALIGMAEVHLKKSFDDSTVRAFEELLEEEYDLSVGGSKWDKEIENQPPPGIGAGPGE